MNFQNSLLTCLFIALCFFKFGDCDYKKRTKIAGIFHSGSQESEAAFRQGIKKINTHISKTELIPVVYHLPEVDGFQVLKLACNLTEYGVGAIFGPQSLVTADVAASVCSNVEIPHLEAHFDTNPKYNSMSINLFPSVHVLASALADLIDDYDWKSFTIIYETDDALMHLQDVIKAHGPDDSPVTIRKLSTNGDYRPLFKEIRAYAESRIVLDCSPDKILNVLVQAKEVGMLGEYQSYILTSLDAHTVDFQEIQHQGMTNITAVRLFDPESYEMRNAVNMWIQGELDDGRRKLSFTPKTVKTEAVLLHDALELYGTALQELEDSPDRPGENFYTYPVECGGVNKWKHGLGLVNYMRLKRIDGLSGSISFDRKGRRDNFHMEVIQLTKSGFKQIAVWKEREIIYTMSLQEKLNDTYETFKNKLFIVSSRLGKPFLMERPEKEGIKYTGNERYEGYSKDLIDGIASILGFNYLFELAPDGRYGSFNKKTRQWDGLIKQLLDGKADLAICDLTITYERRKVVDFTSPFMTLGIGVLYTKPVNKPPDLFSFLDPFAVNVWIYVAAAYLGVSLLLFILARIAPDDWENPHPCNPEPEELENIWNLKNSFWLTMGSIMGQGCDIISKAISTRMVTAMWWFFALIMLASYTANLAAFLTMDKMDKTINNAEELAVQSKIKYGAVTGGSTLEFFKTSNHTTYQRMWINMEATKPSVFTANNDEGIDRVLKGKNLYAFLMESTIIEYALERFCNLRRVGPLLDTKGYGIALPMNSPYRKDINGAVLKMQEEGKLLQLKTKWWKEMYVKTKCPKDEVKDSKKLGMTNVGGVFVVLASGCGVASLIAIIEFMWNVRSVAVEEKIKFWEAFWVEFKFALNIWIRTKPVKHGLNDSNSESRSMAASVLHAAGSFLRLDRMRGDYS